MFWSIIVKNNTTVTFGDDTYVRNAALVPAKSQREDQVTTLAVEAHPEGEGRGDTFVVCHLTPTNPAAQLDLIFTIGEEVTFKVIGPGTLHITGVEVYEESEDSESETAFEVSSGDSSKTRKKNQDVGKHSRRQAFRAARRN